MEIEAKTICCFYPYLAALLCGEITSLNSAQIHNVTELPYNYQANMMQTFKLLPAYKIWLGVTTKAELH